MKIDEIKCSQDVYKFMTNNIEYGCPALPTHAAGAMLQANKLLLHFMPAARTFLVVLPHHLLLLHLYLC